MTDEEQRVRLSYAAIGIVALIRGNPTLATAWESLAPEVREFAMAKIRQCITSAMAAPLIEDAPVPEAPPVVADPLAPFRAQFTALETALRGLGVLIEAQSRAITALRDENEAMRVENEELRDRAAQAEHAANRQGG